MMASVDVTTKITYDALGRAVEIEHSGSFTQIVYSPAGGKLAVMNGQTLVKALVRLPLGATAVYNSSGLAYIRHSDHLGSSRLATTPARTMYASAAYAPYGEAYAVQSAVQGATDLSFTGQDQDTTSGMYDFMVRKYNPVQGRWLSPDPAGLGAVDPANPQTWNRYAYVGNNPLSLIDPLGADAYEGCDPSLQPWCFEGSWTAWIQGLNAMSGWGDPFQVMAWGSISKQIGTGRDPWGEPQYTTVQYIFLGGFNVRSAVLFPTQRQNQKILQKQLGALKGCVSKLYSIDMRSFTSVAPGVNGYFYGLSAKGDVTVETNVTLSSWDLALNVFPPRPIAGYTPLSTSRTQMNYLAADELSRGYFPEALNPTQVHELAHSLDQITSESIFGSSEASADRLMGCVTQTVTHP